jgi:hypothetical protein
MKVIITGSSKKDIQLLVSIAEKMGLKTKILADEEIEDIWLAKANKEGETGEHLDTKVFLKSLN